MDRTGGDASSGSRRQRPSLIEMVIALVVIAAVVADFVRIDRTSHSASDTLIGWAPETVMFVVIGTALVVLIRRGRGRI